MHDSVSLIRGFAIKLVGVEGERLAGSEGDSTQDFLFANGVAFPTPPKKFLANLKLLAKTTDSSRKGGRAGLAEMLAKDAGIADQWNKARATGKESFVLLRYGDICRMIGK